MKLSKKIHTEILHRTLRLLVCCLGPAFAFGQSDAEFGAIAGFNQVVCPGGSDTAIGVPFHRTAVFRGLVQDAPVPASGSALVALAGNPSLESDAFAASPHYLRFVSGSLEGAWYEITGNSADGITIEVGSDPLSGLNEGDAFDVIPHWTLATLFPPTTQSALHPSSGLLPPARRSRLLFANTASDGIEIAPDRIYFVTGEGWFQASAGFPEADDVVVKPSQVIIIRHEIGADDTEFYAREQVHAYAHRVLLRSRSEGPQDNFIGLMRPIPVNLSELGLVSSHFVESTSTAPGDRGDELILYDNLTAALNKTGGLTYFRVGEVWHFDDEDTYPVVSDELIPPSNAILIRKRATATEGTVVWTNTSTY